MNFEQQFDAEFHARRFCEILRQLFRTMGPEVVGCFVRWNNVSDERYTELRNMAVMFVGGLDAAKYEC